MKTHFSFKHLLFLGGAVLYSLQSSAVKNPVDYVSTLVGTQSKFELSTGNTYPATALPWGMNFWTPQTGKMGDGLGIHLRRRQDPRHQADASAQSLDQRLRTVRHHAGDRNARLPIRTNVPPGSRTRPRRPLHIITACTWPTMTWWPRLHLPTVPPQCASHSPTTTATW